MDSPEIKGMQSFGLTTKDALKQLESEIAFCLKKYSKKFNEKGFLWKALKKNMFWLVWMSLCGIAVIVLTLGAYLLDPSVVDKDQWYIVLVVFFGFITVSNWILLIWISIQQEKTKTQKIWSICAKIREMSDCDGVLWLTESYPSLYMPQAPNVHIQWTYRDGCLVSVPSSLLVKGDVILLRPGQDIYASCETSGDENSVQLLEGQKYTCEESRDGNMLSSPEERELVQCQTAIIQCSPFVNHLETYLQKNITSFNKSVPELYILFALKVMIVAVTFSYLLSLIITGIHYVVLRNQLYSLVGLVETNRTFHYTDFILLPIQSLSCGLPVLLPIVWNLMQSYAVGRLYLVYNRSLLMGGHLTDSAESINELKAVEDRAVSLTPSIIEMFTAMYHEFVIQDYSKKSLLLTMGSVSSVCCIDKKGIISHAHATPEKIFFFRRKHRHHLHSHRMDRKRSDTSFAHCADNQSTIHSQISSVLPQHFRGRSESEFSNSAVPNAITMSSLTQTGNCYIQESNAVTLDVSPDPADPYMPVFSDPKWHRYNTSLKPIGLNILLNNCHDSVVPQYVRFADHLTSISANSKKTIAVVNRRCLCGVASEIGFSPNAMNNFRIRSTLGCYRQNNCSSNVNRFVDNAPNDPNERPYSENISCKSPLPNIFSTIAEQMGCGGYQLMSQGTADILVDLCTDYWDGKDIVVMTDSERSRILDFYNRNIFASYCVALAYSPLLEKIELSEMDSILEFPEHWSNREKQIQAGDNQKANKSYSAESLMSRFGLECLKDSQGCQRLLSSQIFLGMISMQYQAMTDVVEIIDRLEEACIRFVHFSKENQLRSRVFAERLGLESGWNCHISLAASQTSLNQSSQYHSSTAIASVPLKSDTRFGGKKMSDVSAMEMAAFTNAKGEATNGGDSLPGGMTGQNSSCALPTVGMHYGSAPNLYRNITRELEEDLEHDKPPQEPHKDTENNGVNFIVAEQAINTVVEKSDAQNVENLCCEQTPLIDQLEKQSGSEVASQNEDSVPGGSSISACSENEETNQENIIEPIPSYLVTTDKSKLPRGIHSIRPHLENIDNVPLQVSLFTDCTPPAVNEMCKIMQDYGEVVSALGSSLTLWNIATFCEADCAIALVPIFPSVCVRHQKDDKLFKTNKSPPATSATVIQPDYGELSNRDAATITPIELAASLGSLPCSINGNRQNGFPVLTLINESRYLVNNLLICVNFFLVCLWAFSMCQSFGSSLLFFQLFTPRHILWMQIVFVPALTVAVLGRRVEQGKPVKTPPQKRLKLFTKKNCIRFALTSTLRFLPSVVVCIFVAWLNKSNLTNYQEYLDLNVWNNVTNNTVDFTPSSTTNIEAVVSEFAFTQMSLYIVIISFSYAIYGHRLLTARPKLNPCWFVVVSLLLIAQILQTLSSCASQSTKFEDFLNLHFSSWILSILWCFILIVCNEFISIREQNSIKAENRLAKLYFGTKLGMYSPV